MDERRQPDLCLKPVIEELARTQVCFPDLKLLVDRISTVTLPSTERSMSRKAYRLYLTDGDRSIQAVLKRKCHGHLTSLDVREGSYVILRAYRLARGRKLSGNGSVLYLIIEDLYTIGEEARDDVDEERHDLYVELIKTPQRQSVKHIDERYGSTKRRILEVTKPNSQQREGHGSQNSSIPYDSTPESLREPHSKRDVNTPGGSGINPFAMPLKYTSLEHQKENRYESFATPTKYPSEFRWRKRCSSISSPIESPSSEHKKRRKDESFEEIDSNLTPKILKITKMAEDAFAAKSNISNDRTRAKSPFKAERTPTTPAKHSNIDHDKTPDKGNTLTRPTQTKTTKEYQLTKSNTTSSFHPLKPPSSLKPPKPFLPITRPLNIRTLASLTGRNATRNKVHDVFAVVCHVDPTTIKPPSMPLKRDIRIMDPSTDKRVLVSVFVDPASFVPEVGTVALFRSMTTHEWERGMLNVYPQHCGGRKWFVRDPVGVEGCDVMGLRDWWERKMEKEKGEGDHGLK